SFLPQYLLHPDRAIVAPPSLVAGQTPRAENAYLMEARTGAIHTISFPRFLNAYEPLMSIPNVRLFAKQAKAFQLFAMRSRSFAKRGAAEQAGQSPPPAPDTPWTQSIGQCMA